METSLKKVEIPSKYEIIPIHASDRGTFKFCRRQWDWSSPARNNLIRKVTVYGVNTNLWFGTGIHFALASFYNPVLREDPEKVFEAWFNTEWAGGQVHYDELDYYADREPVPAFHDSTRSSVVDEHTGLVVPALWNVKGLAELLPQPDVDEFMALKELGIGMMRYYKDYAERNDNFTVIATEQSFSVPILDPNGRVLRYEDTRIMPDWYEGRQGENKEVHARGRRDAVVVDNDTEQYGILEHKTTARLDDDYFRHLELDEQSTTYMWTAEREAQIHDLPYKKIDFTIYNALWKKYPKPPSITSSGKPSIDRQKEMTTAHLFEKTCKELGLELLLEVDPRTKAYYEYLLAMGDKLFIQRGTEEMQYVTRNKAQKENAGRRLYEEALDMLQMPRIYPNPNKSYGCLNCAFRAPCIQKERGEDYEFTLNDGYQANYDR